MKYNIFRFTFLLDGCDEQLIEVFGNVDSGFDPSATSADHVLQVICQVLRIQISEPVPKPDILAYGHFSHHVAHLKLGGVLNQFCEGACY